VVITVALVACGSIDTVLPGPRLIAANIEFQPLLTSAPGEAEQVLDLARTAADGVDREFGVDISRNPDVIEHGIAKCAEAASCLGAEAGTGPWTVWHLRWQPDGRGPWIALFLDTRTQNFIWIGAGRD
jgi:hypothetical protein